MRSSVFYTVLKETFVSIAFEAARAADGSAKLYINDYNLDSANSKVKVTVSKVKSWKSAGAPIDGIGAGGAGGVQAALAALAAAGVSEVAITELKIKGASSNDYVSAMKASFSVSACVGITARILCYIFLCVLLITVVSRSWGMSDKDSWRTGDTPLLFDKSHSV
ncbi:hypothetical protein FRC19_006871 [Serendipita sp. 401]|nr:hypothetical protein FRC15_006924 [Serendipita sp. 397]KAG8822000.1 hypothetical protein FRC19_006871 [Serendipita sp. 401]KAG8866881.1 hypothetical protein FRC20_007245 [Serendipita sp. 405]